MPYIFRLTFTYAGQEQGFAESYYFQRTSNDVNLAMDFCVPISFKRAALLASGYTLVGMRVSCVQEVGGGAIKRQSRYIEPRIAGVPSWAPAQPNVALLCRWETGNANHNKPMYMRGVPSDLGDEGKKPNTGFGTWLSRFNSWRAQAIADQFGWYQLVETTSDLVLGYVANAQTGIVTFTVGPGITWPVMAGQQVPVWVSMPNKNPLDGRIMVVRSADDIHPYTAKPIGVGPFTGIGRMALKAPTFLSLAPVGGGGAAGQIHPLRMVTHKTGRPTSASRGRRLAKAQW